MTVEVFRTNVTDADDAASLLACIHARFPEYKTNFDLDDCDRILRVQCNTGFVHTQAIIRLMGDAGYYAIALTDDDNDGSDPSGWPQAIGAAPIAIW
jgi:hypothetical protein